MLRTIAAGLIVTALIAGPAAGQPSGGTNSTPTTATTKHPAMRSKTKSTSRLKQTNTTGKPRHDVVNRRGSGQRHSVGRHHTLRSDRHPASTTNQLSQSNGSQKASKTESNTNTQK